MAGGGTPARLPSADHRGVAAGMTPRPSGTACQGFLKNFQFSFPLPVPAKTRCSVFSLWVLVVAGACAHDTQVGKLSPAHTHTNGTLEI